MRLPRIQTTVAAALLLCAAAPFALAAQQTGAAAQSTPGATPPETMPGTTNPGTLNPQMRSPGAAQSQRQQGQATQPGSRSMQNRSMEGQSLQSGGSMSSNGWSGGQARLRAAERVPRADIAAARKAKVSLTDAISDAQQQRHGNVVSVRFQRRQGQSEYLVRTFDSIRQQEWVGHIDANTGRAIGQGQTIPLSRLPKEDQRELAALQGTGTTLAQAVETAEQQRGGKALSAGLTARNGRVSYRTELLKSNGSTHMAMISPQSGQLGRYR